MGKDSYRILIAGSGGNNDRALAQSFKRLTNLEVVGPVSSGSDVLEVLLAKEADALLLDTTVRGLDALSILCELEARTGIKVPVFTISVFVDDTVLTVLQRLGVIYCFAKPVSPDHAAKQVERLISCMNGGDGLMQENDAILSREEIEKKEITRQIRAVGVPAHLKGYHYLRKAIHMLVSSKEPYSVPITKEVYPTVAKEFSTKPELVERAIRNAIEVAWTRGNTRVLESFFGYTIDDKKGKPTNSEFIAMLADRVRFSTGK